MATTSGGTGPDEKPRQGVPPLLAGGAILALILIAGVALYLTTREDPIDPMPVAQGSIPPAPSEAEPPTEAEAIAIFKDLDRMRLALYRNPDPRSTRSVFVEGSAIARRVRRELRQLAADGISARPRIDERSFRVLMSQPFRLRVEQEIVISNRFVARQDREDVTTRKAKQRQTIVWDLALVATEWRIMKARIVEAKAL